MHTHMCVYTYAWRVGCGSKSATNVHFLNIYIDIFNSTLLFICHDYISFICFTLLCLHFDSIFRITRETKPMYFKVKFNQFFKREYVVQC